MIKVKRTFNNGLFECEEIYSDIGMKILEKSNGQPWNTDKDNPITIAVSRRNDYVETSEPATVGVFERMRVETSEPIKPIAVDIREPIKEEEV